MKFRKWLVLPAALLLCVLLGTCAMAEGGNVILWRGVDDTAGDISYSSNYMSQMMVCGSQIYGISEGMERNLLIFDPENGTSRSLDMRDLLAIPDDADYSEDVVCWFARQDEVYAVIVRNENGAEYGEEAMPPEGGFVRRLSLDNDSPRLVETDIPQLDWDAMIEGNESWYGVRSIRTAFCLEDTLCLLTYDDSYNDQLVLYDLEIGSCEEQYLQNVNTMSPGPDGQIIITRYVWDDTGSGMEVTLYDPVSASSEKLAVIPGETGMLQSICCSEADNTLYYTRSGELWRVPGMDFSQAVSVNDDPLQSETGSMIIPDGRILLYNYQTALLRTTDPSQRQEITLRVTDYAYASPLDSAYYDFIGKNGSISVVVDRYGSFSDILQAMMNQDSSTDIYCLDMSSSVFESLFKRGFMAPLNSSEKLMKLVDGMYPAASSSVKSDGNLLAVPLSASGSSIGYNPNALTRAGLTEADLPKTWDAFFDFLNQLPSRLEGTNVRVFPYWSTISEVRQSLLVLILSDYEAYTRKNGISLSFDDPVLQQLLERLGQLNGEALGLRSDEEEISDEEWVEDGYLLELGVPTTIASYGSVSVPLLLSINDGDPVSSYQVNCVFINPYSAHIPEAIAYIETVSDHIMKWDLYSMSPENNEPIRYPDFEETKEYLTQTIAEYKSQLEETEDPDTREMLEQMLGDMEESLNSMDDTYWMISPASIASYQARAPYLVPATWGFQSIISDSSDASFFDLYIKFGEGTISGRELLEQLNKKYQMMLQEGN